MASISDTRLDKSISIEGDVKFYKEHEYEVSRLFTLIKDQEGFDLSEPMWDLERFMPLLDRIAITMEVGRNFDYLPDNLSYTLYGTHELWPILMRLNGVSSRNKFIGPVFRVLDINSINILNSIMESIVQTRNMKKDTYQVTDLTIKQVYSQ